MDIDIRDVDFGRLDAERDAKLASYFIDTGVADRIASGEKQYVIGRKGSGKTALFKEAKIPTVGIIRIEFDDYAWEAHKAIREQGMPAENAYTSSWMFTFLIAACREWMKSPKQEVRSDATKVHRAIYGADEGGFLDILVDKAKRIRKLELPNLGDAGGFGGFELDNLPEGERLAMAANAWNRQLLDLVNRVFGLHPVSIFVDRLDDGWDATEEMASLLAGALKATRALNIKNQGRARIPFVVLFLRSDIFQYIRFNDKNKIGADIELVTWNKESLIEIARKRISESVPVKRELAWESVFSDKRMRQGTTIEKYIVKRTMLRPRDLIAFCIECKSVAVKAGHKIVETQDVYEAEVNYSRHVYNELVDEMHKQIPNVDLYFQAINQIGYARFGLDQWRQAVAKVFPRPEDALEWLKILYGYAVIGVPKVGGKGGGSKVEFVYESNFTNANFEEVVVHPALIKYLQLKEGSAIDDTPVDFDGDGS